MQYHQTIKLLASLFVLSLMVNCKSDSSDVLFAVENEEAAQMFFATQLSPVINDKCISCHEGYHGTGANRYDTYEKTIAIISDIDARIHATNGSVMPTINAEALTDEELALFEEFIALLDSDTPIEEEEEVVKPFAVNWTAYKYPDRFEGREGAGVGGTFDDIEYSFNMDYQNTIDILDGAEITIATSSVNVANNEPVRTGNVGAFFDSFTPDIIGEVITYNNEEVVIAFTMNEATNTYILNVDIDEVNNRVTLSGSIPDLNDFQWIEGFNVLQELCGAFHEDKLWSDVDIEAIINIEALNTEQ